MSVPSGMGKVVSPQQSKEDHFYDDVDQSPSSHHHTLGKGPTQAAPGNHTHPGGGGGVTDHGLLTGLSDDDHTQYVKVDGTRAFTGVVTIPAGAVGAPSLISSLGSSGTGLWFPAADTVAFSTAATERLRISSSGVVYVYSSQVLINSPVNPQPDASLHIKKRMQIDSDGSSGAGIWLGNSTSGTTNFLGNVDVDGTSSAMGMWVNGGWRFYVTITGRVVVTANSTEATSGVFESKRIGIHSIYLKSGHPGSGGNWSNYVVFTNQGGNTEAEIRSIESGGIALSAGPSGTMTERFRIDNTGATYLKSPFVYHEGGASNNNRYIFTRSAGYQHGFKFRTGSSDRWDIFVASDAESGSNAGSDLKISRYSDASTWLGDPWVLSRATGEMYARESLTVFPNAGTNVALKVQGASGQSADLQQWQNSSGSPVAGITGSGFWWTYDGMQVNGGGGFEIINTVAATIPFKIQAHASQSGNLTEWRNSSAVAQSYVKANGGFVLVAGTTAFAPLQLQSGTNLTTPVGGAFEYDGKVKYFTPNSAATAGRALDRSEYLLVSGADLTLSNATGVQSLFAAANDTITVAAGTSYYFECEFHQTGTGTTSHTLNFALGGTLTTYNVQYQSYVSQNATGSGTPATTANYACYIATAASTAITAATATAIYRTVRIRGVIRVNASGTLIPQVAFSAAPGVAPVIKTGAMFKLIPVGAAAASTANVVGAWG